jgi:hypothetical protein
MYPAAVANTPPRINLGTKADRPDVLVDLPEAFVTHGRHMGIFGITRGGKGRLIQRLIRHAVAVGIGGMYIDPHGDDAEDIFAWAHDQEDRTKDSIEPLKLANIVYLEPRFDHTFSYNPAVYQPPPGLPPELLPNHRAHWMKGTIENMGLVVARKQGESTFEGRARFERYLTNYLYGGFVSIRRTDGSTTHLPIPWAMDLLNPAAPYHEDFFRRISGSPEMPRQHLADLTDLCAAYDPRRPDDRTDSNINRGRSLFSGPISAILSAHATGQAPSLDLPALLQQGRFILLNLRNLSVEQRNALAGMMHNQVVHCARMTERTRRLPIWLLEDEISGYLNRDMAEMLKQSAKWKLSAFLAAQNLSSFRKENLDLTQDVLGLCEVLVSFQQKSPEDLDTFARVLYYPNLDFTERLQEVQRQRGWIELETEEHSYGEKHGTNWKRGGSRSRNNDVSVEHGQQLGRTKNWDDSTTEGDTVGHASQRGDGTAIGDVNSATNAPIISAEREVGRVLVPTTGSNITRTSQNLEGDSVAHMTQHAHREGGGLTNTKTRSVGRRSGLTDSEDWGEGGNVEYSHNVAIKTHFLPNIVSEMERTGQLEQGEVDLQFHKAAKQLRTLKQQHALAAIQHHLCFELRVADVPDPLRTLGDPLFKAKWLEIRKRQHWAKLPFCFTPDLTEEGERRRIEQWLAATALPDDDHEPDHDDNGRGNGRLNGQHKRNGRKAHFSLNDSLPRNNQIPATAADYSEAYADPNLRTRF